MKIVVVSGSYPQRLQPARGVFVYNLVEEWRRQGHEVVVIAPLLLGSKYFKSWFGNSSAASKEDTGTVHRPKALSFSNLNLGAGLSTAHLTQWSFNRVVFQAIRALPWTPDLVYGHFLFPAGASCVAVTKQFGYPHLVALGEDDLADYYPTYGRKTVLDVAQKLQGVVSVSNKNAEFCKTQWQIPEKSIIVRPNAVNLKHFYPRDKGAMRAKYGLDPSQFLVAFLGYFITRKGPLRVLEAIEDLPVAGLFIGEGPQQPHGSQVAFNKPMPSELVPELLSAADALVLPTRSEGSCNAIVEAMACGLPIIASDIEAIKEQVKEQNAILVPWNDTQKLKGAIKKLLDEPDLVESMSARSLQLAANMSLTQRAQSILNFAQENSQVTCAE